MKSQRAAGLAAALLAGALLAQGAFAQDSGGTPQPRAEKLGATVSTPAVETGRTIFQQSCAFCHGRGGFGGESGPSLLRSKLVTQDVNGDKIGLVVRKGRIEKGMPMFSFSDEQIAGVAAFLHNLQDEEMRRPGNRKGVEVADLQTGNLEAGKQYFNGAGKCASCHSPEGDLAGIASRLEGLDLMKQMLYPKDAKAKVTVTLPSGKTIAGKLKYLDEFTVGLIDDTHTYRSWRTSDVKYVLDPGLSAHAELLGKYSDDNIHDLMAYLQTLR